MGLRNTRLIEGLGNPLVYGEWLEAKGKPTLLIYGHYDVQPADPSTNGNRRRSSPTSAATTSSPAAPLTTRGKSTYCSKPWKGT